MLKTFESIIQLAFAMLDEKIAHPINEGNKKILIFSAFSDTAEYLYENVSHYMKDKYGLNTAVITGNIDGHTTIPNFKATFNNVFSRISMTALMWIIGIASILSI